MPLAKEGLKLKPQCSPPAHKNQIHLDLYIPPHFRIDEVQPLCADPAAVGATLATTAPFRPEEHLLPRHREPQHEQKLLEHSNARVGFSLMLTTAILLQQRDAAETKRCVLQRPAPAPGTLSSCTWPMPIYSGVKSLPNSCMSNSKEKQFGKLGEKKQRLLQTAADPGVLQRLCMATRHRGPPRWTSFHPRGKP